MTLAARSRAALRDGPLASRPFRLLTAGQVSSTIGDYCYAVALPWLVLSAHGGTVLLGAVLACYGIPRTVLIPAGGVLADRLGPRAVMLGADCVRCGLAAAMTALAAGHLVTLAALGPVAAVLGAGEGVFIPASMAIMPTLLPAARLPAGNAVNMAALQAGSLLGPVLGGALVATAGPAPAFGVDAASFAVSAAALAAMARPRPAASPAPGAAGATDKPQTQTPPQTPARQTPPRPRRPPRFRPGRRRTLRAECSRCCAGPGCCSCSWPFACWRTSRSRAPSRWRCQRSRTRGSARPATAR